MRRPASLRAHRRLVQLCLAWFVLALAGSVASAFVRPGSVQMVCSAGPMKWVQVDADGQAAAPAAALDCPLCATPMTAAPASVASTLALSQAPAATPLQAYFLRVPNAPRRLPPNRGPPVA